MGEIGTHGVSVEEANRPITNRPTHGGMPTAETHRPARYPKDSGRNKYHQFGTMKRTLVIVGEGFHRR